VLGFGGGVFRMFGLRLGGVFGGFWCVVVGGGVVWVGLLVWVSRVGALGCFCVLWVVLGVFGCLWCWGCG